MPATASPPTTIAAAVAAAGAASRHQRRLSTSSDASSDGASSDGGGDDEEADAAAHVVSERRLAERFAARELALDAAKDVPYLRVPNVRAGGAADNHFWQFEAMLPLENPCPQCQGCFPEPPWWHHGKPKPDARHLVDKGEGSNRDNLSSFAVAYFSPVCSRSSLIRAPVADWRAHVDEEVRA